MDPQEQTASLTGYPYPPSTAPLLSYGSDPGLMPSDDKMVDVWLALHGDKESKTGIAKVYTRPARTDEEQELYDLLTKSLIERAKNYGSMERP